MSRQLKQLWGWLRYLDDARQHGTIVAGGNVLDREGYFIQPTIVRDISDNARLVREDSSDQCCLCCAIPISTK